MFQPFQSVADFYPGLIVWCDPAGLDSIDRDPSKLGLGFLYDCKKSRDLRPCLVISVDYSAETFEAARLSASTPADPSQWAQIDSPPPITWKLNDAWIWIGELPTIPMVFDNAKVMHPNRDEYYSTNPVASANLQSYWVHRQAYINRQLRAKSGRHSPPASGTHLQDRPSHPPQARPPRNHSNHSNHAGGASRQPQAHAPPFSTLSPQPVVVPPGFTETRAGAPGWWRNPQTGWFWHASRGLLPPN